MLGGLFSMIQDQRTAKGRRYALEPLLCSLLLAMLSGATSLRKMQLFIDERREELNALFGTRWKAGPTWVGIRRFLLTLPIDQLEPAVRAQGERLVDRALPEGHVYLAIDGKALRGSASRIAGARAAQLVSAFLHEELIVLGHIAVDGKSHEIAAAQALIAALGRPGHVFTLDALHCQKKPCSWPWSAAPMSWCRSKVTRPA